MDDGAPKINDYFFLVQQCDDQRANGVNREISDTPGKQCIGLTKLDSREIEYVNKNELKITITLLSSEENSKGNKNKSTNHTTRNISPQSRSKKVSNYIYQLE